MQDGVLCIDLKKDGTIVTSNRNSHGGPKDTAVASG